MGRTRANAQSVTGPSLLVPFITAWSTTLETEDGDSGMKSMATLQSVVEALRLTAGVVEGDEVSLDEILPSSQGAITCRVRFRV